MNFAAIQFKMVHPTRIVLVVAIVTLLLILVVADLVPRFHDGDSAIFIYTRLGGYIPKNRSWTYGLTLGWITRTSAQLIGVPLAQIFLSWTAFALFGIATAASLNMPRPAAIALMIIGVLEPLGYYWSRSFMPDSPAQSAFVLLYAAMLWRSGGLTRFMLVFTMGFVLISLRVVYFPAILTALIIAAACRFLAARNALKPQGHARNVLADPALRSWAIALAAILAANVAYAYMNTKMTHGRVLSTDVGDMEFLVGALSPVMGDDLDKTPLTAAERAALPPLTYQNRLRQTFSPDGLVLSVRRHFASTEDARPAMRRLLLSVALHHPGALAELVLRQWLDYLNPLLVVPNQYAGRLSGAVPVGQVISLPDRAIHILESWKVRPAPTRDMPSKPSVALWYLETFGGIWSLVLSYYATFSIVWVYLLPGNKRSGFVVFTNSFAFFYLATIVVGANQLVTRYLLPLDAPMLYTVCAAICSWRDNPTVERRQFSTKAEK